MACDFAYNAGPQAARKLLAHRDAAVFTLHRQLYYWKLRQNNPTKYGRYFDGWIGRSLRAWQAAVEMGAQRRNIADSILKEGA